MSLDPPRGVVAARVFGGVRARSCAAGRAGSPFQAHELEAHRFGGRPRSGRSRGGKRPGAIRAPAKHGPRGGFRVCRGQATLELLVVVVIVLGIATGVARLAGQELVRAQAEHAIDRGLQAEVAGDGAPAEAVLAALPAVLRRSAYVGVTGRSLTVTVDPPGPIGRVRITAPTIGGS